jgi:hypothetical protein
MRRFALALSAIAVAVVVSSCAVGVRQPATNITTTGATLNGKVLSTTGGPGSYYVEHAEFVDFFGEGPPVRTPVRPVDFVANQLLPVSEAVTLPPGRARHYRVCAEDSENPGDPFCSLTQSFRTIGDSVVGEAVIDRIEDLSHTISLDVGSGSTGDSPSGYALQTDYAGRSIGGTARCLKVQNNRAVIGLEYYDPIRNIRSNNYTVIEDGGPTGPDRISGVGIGGGGGSPTDCGSVPGDVPLNALLESDIVVTDAQPPPT